MAKFDIAISFAGEDRAVAKLLAEELSRRGMKVFYDDYEQAALLGENLTEYLIDIYKDKASYCVVLVSSSYLNKRWTRHEWKAAQARAFEEFDRAYILPIRLDNSELPGLLPTTGYLTIDHSELSLSIQNICNVIARKASSTAVFSEKVRIAERSFDKGDARRAIELLEPERDSKEFQADLSAMKLLANSYIIVGDYSAAEQVLAHLTKRFPGEPEFWFLRGTCLFRLENLDAAATCHEECLKIKPNHYTANMDLIMLRRLRFFLKIPILKQLVQFTDPHRAARRIIQSSLNAQGK